MRLLLLLAAFGLASAKECDSSIDTFFQCLGPQDAEEEEGPRERGPPPEIKAGVKKCFEDAGCRDPEVVKEQIQTCVRDVLTTKVGPAMQQCASGKGFPIPQVILDKMTEGRPPPPPHHERGRRGHGPPPFGGGPPRFGGDDGDDDDDGEDGEDGPPFGRRRGGRRPGPPPPGPPREIARAVCDNDATATDAAMGCARAFCEDNRHGKGKGRHGKGKGRGRHGKGKGKGKGKRPDMMKMLGCASEMGQCFSSLMERRESLCDCATYLDPKGKIQDAFDMCKETAGIQGEDGPPSPLFHVARMFCKPSSPVIL